MTLHTAPTDRYFENITFQVDRDWQAECINCTASMQFLSAGRGSGKRLHVDTLLPTPDGYIRNGDVVTGTRLIGSAGTPITVIQAHPIEMSTKAYRVVFDDGTEIVADAEHLWSTATKFGPRGRKNVARRRDLTLEHTAKTTQEIADTIRVSKGKETNHTIPVVQFKGEHKELPCHPYMLGVWLGDGTTSAPNIVCGPGDEDTFIRLRELNYPISHIHWMEPKTKGAHWHPQFTMRGLHGELWKMGLIKQKYANGKRYDLSSKFIPEVYFLSSVEQRMELLRGLMDTDGYADGSRNTCELGLSDEDLAYDAYRLVNSLGIKATITRKKTFYRLPDGTRKQCKDSYTIRFVRYADQEPVFHLSRKQEKLRERGRDSGQDRRYIVDCIPTDNAPMRCLTVDAEDHQYCVTGSFILTHNTSCVARVKLLKGALTNIDHEYAFYSPSYEIAKREKARLVRDPVIKTNIAEHSNVPTPFIRFVSGSIIRYKSTVLEENLLGSHYDGIVVDEAQTHSEALIDNIIIPTLTAKQGWLMLMGQFDIGGQDGWLYKRFYLPGQQLGQDRYKSWIIPSSAGVMYGTPQGQAELEQIRSTTDPMTFKRQYEAQPVEAANLAFRREDLAASKVGKAVSKPAAGSPVILGVDIGRVVDPTFWVALQPLAKDRAVILNCGTRPLGERFEIQAVEIERVRAAYGARTVVVDNSGGGMGGKTVKGTIENDVYSGFFKKTVSHCRPWYFTRKSKSGLMQQLQLAFEQRRIQVPAELGVLHNQLSQFRWELRRGFVDYEGPGGHGDDGVCALSMAWNACLLGWWTNDATAGAGIDSLLM